MTIRLHRGDLPDLSRYKDSVAIDTETMGLNPHRDRLCVVQMSNGDGTADVIQIPKDHGDAPNLKALLANTKIIKIFHFARFDLADRAYVFAIRLVGETTEILNNQGYSYMLRGDLVNARRKFLKAYEREPGLRERQRA